MQVTTLVRAVRAAQYDGTNGVEICAAFSGVIVSDTGTVLTFHPQDEPSVEHVANVGTWIFWQDVAGPQAVVGTGATLLPFPFVVVLAQE